MKKKQSPIFITLGVVVLMLCYYFFIYLPANERDLRSQRFRVLENIDINLQSKIINSAALLENLLKGYLKERPVYKTQLNTYIQNFPQKDFELLPIKNLGVNPSLKANVLEVEKVETTIAIDSNSQNFDLLLTKNINNILPKKDSVFRIGLRSTLQRFIIPLFPETIFDEYIIFKDNNVVWESFPSGIVNAQRDSILIKDKGILSSGVRDLSSRGVGYKMFLQPVKFGGRSNLIIAGLLTDERYSQEKKQLQMHMLMLLTTLVIIIIVAFPWLKLYQMGSKDRLTISDGIGSVVVAILLSSLFFFVFFKYNVLLRPDHTDDARQSLANAISSTLIKEIDTAYNALARLDTLITKDNSLRLDIREVQSQTAKKGNFYENKSDSIPFKKKQRLNSITIPVNTNETFWIEGSGWEIYNWTSRAENAPHNNLGTRAYFKRINSGSTYQLNGNILKPYFLEQIVSWTRGGFTTVISRRSLLPKDKDSIVAAMSFNLKSLQNTVMTDGYQFAIVNKNGLVIYHTDPSKNLNENLKKEFSETNELLSNLESGSAKKFVTNYGGKRYKILCQQVPNLPYFVVLFDNTIYKETRDI
ncbi:MAG: hypothetical protein EOO43_10460, partial [Flavobacterium sp.]